MDKALKETPGPWLLGGDRPSLVDFQYVYAFAPLPKCTPPKWINTRNYPSQKVDNVSL
jgi:hypothetical protein